MMRLGNRMLDVPYRQKDTLLADHVIRIHRYRDPKEEDGDPFKINECADVLSLTTLGDNWSGIEKKMNSQFVSNYIKIAKVIKPEMTVSATNKIAEEYAALRCLNPDDRTTLPITTRTLESLIRLSTAHAKARLSKAVESRDVTAATELMRASYLKKY